MEFVDEEDGALAMEGLAGAGFGDAVAYFGDVGFDAVEHDEVGRCLLGDDGGDGGFADAGRAVEEEGGEAVGFDGTAEEFAGGEEVLLPDDFTDGAGAHACGQRHGFERGGLRACVVASSVWREEIHQGEYKKCFHGGQVWIGAVWRPERAC